jgi:hypothetical protein
MLPAPKCDHVSVLPARWFHSGRWADLSDADTSAVGAKTEATLDIHRKSTMDQRRRALTRLLDERSKSKRLSTGAG